MPMDDVGGVTSAGRETPNGVLERAIINLDVGVPGALLRIALGFLFFPTLQLVNAQPSSWTVAFALLAMLFAVKAVTALARRVVPASDIVRSRWKWRRDLAAYHDSYQWRKLLWIGIGILISTQIPGPGMRIQWVLGALCCGAGCLAELLWRRLALGVAPPGGA